MVHGASSGGRRLEEFTVALPDKRFFLVFWLIGQLGGCAPPDPPFPVGLWPPKIDIIKMPMENPIVISGLPISEAGGRPGMGGLGGAAPSAGQSTKKQQTCVWLVK